jgi:hypothetical protein
MAKRQPDQQRTTKPVVVRAYPTGWPFIGMAAMLAGIGGLSGPAQSSIGADMRAGVARTSDLVAPRLWQIAASDNGFRVSDVTGLPGRSAPLNITLPPPRGEPFRMLVFRGLPEELRLSAGTRLDDAWVISPDDAGRLTLEVPDDYNGAFQLEIRLMHGRGDLGERQTIQVRIAPQPDAPAAAKAPLPEPIAPEREAAMIERGRQMVELGDIAGARLIFEFLAARDIPAGIFALAQTYDPEFLIQMQVRGGVQPDLARAIELYRRAAAAGSQPASTRLGAVNLGN